MEDYKCPQCNRRGRHRVKEWREGNIKSLFDCGHMEITIVDCSLCKVFEPQHTVIKDKETQDKGAEAMLIGE